MGIKNIIIRWINMNKPKNIIILDNMHRKNRKQIKYRQEE